jgi:F-type H+-transporting ATPase subunit gamma
VIAQVPTAQQIIPPVFPRRERPKDARGGAVYEFEPDEETILAKLLPRNLAVQIYRALLESAGRRAGAR